MIENARRQAILVVLVTALAVIFAVKDKPALGLDLSGGTQLIYELDIPGARSAGELPPDVSDSEVMTETLSILGERIDPAGTRDPVITKRGEFGVLIELPDVGETEAEIIKRQIETLGRLEMRLLATPEYNEEGVRFELDDEKKRLEDWLALEGNMDMVREFPERVDVFNTLSTAEGGRNNQEHLWWYPAKVMPSPRDSTRWDFADSVGQNQSFVVGTFDSQEYAAGPPPKQGKDDPYLVEFYPVNMHAVHFTGEDMNAAGVRATTNPDDGTPCVQYEIAAGKKAAYADWSGDNKGNRSAIILNGFVKSAPSFLGRILNRGIITGRFTVQEAADLAKVIKTGSLQVKPEFVSSTTIGATLGARSINRGLWSICIGGVLVLLFILAYYRLAGMVAFTAIALNLLLIYGVVLFVKATITLPGIAGLVLTMGMAVDANILIYERIREEIKKGKELLQAVRTGFDRAMVTILDANITTFIAGVVLYNVGVGPVRGFAVTLMVGILTSLFAALVVTRLVFHYLIEGKKLTEFRAAGWFTGLSFDFVSKGRAAFVASVVFLVLGLGYVSVGVSTDRMLGLDFTGGASMQVSLADSRTEQQVRQELPPAFTDEYPDPLINSLGGEGKSFSIKVKLTSDQRDKLDRDKAAAKAAGESYEPPFKSLLLQGDSLPLVARAFSDVTNLEMPSGPTNLGTAEVHFANPVKLDDVRASLARYGEATVSSANPNDPEDVTEARNVFVEIPVRKSVPASEIENMIAVALDELVDESGEQVALSNPIPSAEVIGSRMVGELRTAAIGAMVLSLFLIVMYIRLRFREYKYGIAAVIALVHDVLVTFCVVVVLNATGLVNAEIDLPMIAAFLTIIGYSINDTIVIFDRVRENTSEHERLGDSKETFPQLVNRSINQTLSRTILTSGTTLFVVLAVFLVNKGSGSGLEGFSFALIIGILSGTYSTMFIASPLILWLRAREEGGAGTAESVAKADSKVAVETTA